MRYYRRGVVFTKRPLKEALIVQDAFILQPIVRHNIPYCPYATHYPSYLDYWLDAEDGMDDFALTELDINKKREICTILTALSNFEVFIYDSSLKAWGIIAPSKKVEEMTLDELQVLDNNAKNSVWLVFSGYLFDGIKEDQMINSLTLLEGNREMILDTNPFYFTDNPIEDDFEKVIFQDKIQDVIKNYYSLPVDSQKIVFSAMVLIANGIKFSLRHQSIGFISYVSSIETMVDLENKNVKVQHCKTCGQPIFSVKKKFLAYLEKYVSKTEKSKKKFSDLYTLRSRIAHSGKLFLSDVEFSSLNREENDKEWFKYMEIQQLARLSLYRWLLFN